MGNGGLTEAFDRVKEQIGYCGIWCGSCIVGNGTLRELTKRYEALIRDYGLQHWGPEGLDFDGFTKGLSSIHGVSLCPGCRKDGGREGCVLRSCAVSRGLQTCNACPEIKACPHMDDLQHMRSGALKAGLFVTTQSVERARLLRDWKAELKTKWPHYILFDGAG